MFSDGDPSAIDLLQNLKEHEKDPEKKRIFDEDYSDKLLIFDLDPQDPLFSSEKIMEMVDYFVESSDMGKLYLNYPMVEAFYHMRSIPDLDFYSCVASLEELKSKRYKSRVNQENRNHNYDRFAVDKEECNIVINQNVEKACLLTKQELKQDVSVLQGVPILEAQIKMLQLEQMVSVLCTCVFYIIEYNPKLVWRT